MLNLSPPVDAAAATAQGALLSTITFKTIYGSMLSTFVPFLTVVSIAAALHHGTSITTTTSIILTIN